LRALSRDRDPEIRRRVASNSAIDKDLREALASDDSRDVRIAVTRWQYMQEENAPIIGNPSVTKLIEVVRRLIQREEMKTKGLSIQRPEITSAFLLNGLYGLHLIPRRPSARFLSEATKSKDWLTRLAVALHPMTKPTQLKQLERDEVADVVAAVRYRTSGVWAN